METNPIETELGALKFRDTVILKTIETKVNPLRLVLSGLIDGTQCTKPVDNRYIPFSLSFDAIQMYNCFKLDLSPIDKYMKSSFDEIADSELLEKMRLANSHKHYVLSTYDYILEIVAKDFELILN